MRSPEPISLTRLRREHRYLEALVQAGEILGTALDWEQTIHGVCSAVVNTIADICLLDLKDDEGNLRLVAAAHRDPELTPQLQRAGIFLRAKSRPATHPVLIAVATGEPIRAYTIDEEYLRTHAVSAEHEQFMRRMKYRSLIVVPLLSVTQGVLGSMTLVRTDETEEQYDDEALRFAQDLARRCTNAIAKAKLYEQTLHVATVYQKAALPARLPSCDGITFDAFYEPSSKELLVGGDWYDAFQLADGRIAITVGDVLGHGIEAAVWMSRLRNGLRAALFAEPDPTHALEVADQMLRTEGREEFTTALVGLIDPVRNTLSCTSAGHPGPLVWDTTGEVMDPFAERGLPIGLRNFGPVAKTAQTLSLRAGAFAVFFTDGLLEWNRNIAQAWSRLEAAVARQDVREALHPAHAIRHCVIDGSNHDDDIAVLTVRWDKLVQPRR